MAFLYHCTAHSPPKTAPLKKTIEGQIVRIGTVCYAEGLWHMRRTYASYSALYRFGIFSHRSSAHHENEVCRKK